MEGQGAPAKRAWPRLPKCPRRLSWMMRSSPSLCGHASFLSCLCVMETHLGTDLHSLPWPAQYLAGEGGAGSLFIGVELEQVLRCDVHQSIRVHLRPRLPLKLPDLVSSLLRPAPQFLPVSLGGTFLASHLHRNPPKACRVHLKEIKGNSQLARI